MACETPSTTKLILGLVLLISFLYLIINYYSAIKTSHLLAIFNLSATNSLLPCKDPDARENFKRAKTLLQGKHNTSLSEIDQIATMEIARYDCSYQDPAEPKIIIVVPYRHRELDLLSFILHMVPYFRHLVRQMEILVAEQNGTGPFNRAKLFNAAIREIKKAPKGDRLSGSKCFAFHDVDKLPINLDVPYSCATGPRQLLRILHSDDSITETYSSFLGGVTMFSMYQLERINGASNSFVGWGGEDDDLWRRTQMARMKVVKPDKNKGQFYEGNYQHSRAANPNRLALLKRENQESIMRNDGLRQVNYTLRSRVNYNTFVWLLLDV
ncbi:unnamed protein product [Rodentolepis nana]|uniref:Beta-1,4-galactosyltransferase n=1 Tax=Rodentolepis nana TaxID=102285 RepID=A0A0R3U061_RODNA|nr:unnamed protein product [Rodentolepis nana]